MKTENIKYFVGSLLGISIVSFGYALRHADIRFAGLTAVLIFGAYLMEGITLWKNK